jgi:hypothetical protein
VKSRPADQPARERLDAWLPSQAPFGLPVYVALLPAGSDLWRIRTGRLNPEQLGLTD